jgi:hypothetical protein
MQPRTEVLVLGFYNRQNIGDDAYTIVIPSLLDDMNTHVRCVSMDDIDIVPQNTDIVILGGGDLINDYFMSKAQSLLKDFVGKVYGLSIGIPYQSCTHYLHIFDHVFVRSREDYKLACAEIGLLNVTYCPDITTFIPMKPKPINTNTNIIRVGVCLAQPLFYNNPKKTVIVNSLCNALIRFSNEMQSQDKIVQYNFIAFNFCESSTQECDQVINNLISKQLDNAAIHVQQHHDLQTPQQIIDFINESTDMTLCMRYHSVMFSLLTNTPFVPLYLSKKIDNLLKDVSYREEIACKLEPDTKYRPKLIDEDRLFESLKHVSSRLGTNIEMPYHNDLSNYDKNIIKKRLLEEQPYAQLTSIKKLKSFENVITTCKTSMCKYLNLDTVAFETLLYSKSPLFHDEKTSIEIARFICYIVTGQTNHPCVWGLAENIEKDNFCLFDALKYIWEDTKISYEATTKNVQYYPKLNKFKRRTLINVDFIFSNDFSQYHRSGWSYVVGGLMNIDATRMLKQSEIFVDTYVDRSFNWGSDVLKSVGELPYKKPWYGFIHHTFDTTHSDNNCTSLLGNQDFLESLNVCKGLIALTSYLAVQLREALTSLELGYTVPVHVLYHPMEFVDNNFTMDKFMANTERKIVQIGAWLRRPYTIYELPLPIGGGPLAFKKCALRGKEMEHYFSPPNFFEVMDEVLLKRNWYQNIQNNAQNQICRPHSICRPCKSSTANKYCTGVHELILRNHESVQILEKLSNEEYDKLLSENIVFLDLVDCSAVNTVIECIVRHTVLVVNKIPPLVEVLGEEYPGFYNTYNEAVNICMSHDRIRQAHNYLIMLDKSRYNLDNFIEEFQNIIQHGETTVNHTLFQENIGTTLLPKQFRNFARFLPLRYRLNF